jgi:hypothetical protein
MASMEGAADRAAQAEAEARLAKAQRDSAVNSAIGESARRKEAEGDLDDVKLKAANAEALAREYNTQRSALHHELEHERAAAENHAFGFYLVSAVLLAMLLVAGIVWYNNSQREPTAVQVTTAVPAAPHAPVYRAPVATGPVLAPPPAALIQPGAAAPTTPAAPAPSAAGAPTTSVR